MSLDGAVAVVTGGSRGIGAAVCSALLRDGAKVYSLARTAADAALDGQGDYTWLATDVADEQAVNARIGEILAEKRGVQILVNNAGITRDGLVFRMSRQDWDAVLALNLTATFLTCKLVARDMARRRAGSIINVSSVVGLTGNPGQTNYCASKAGIIGFSKSLAREVAGRGVRVNVVAPRLHRDRHDRIAQRRDTGEHHRHDSARPHRNARGRGRNGGVPGLGPLHLRHRTGAAGGRRTVDVAEAARS